MSLNENILMLPVLLILKCQNPYNDAKDAQQLLPVILAVTIL